MQPAHLTQLFYHRTGQTVGCKYCFDLGLDGKPSIEAKCTSQSTQCLLTLDYDVIIQYNYTAITLTLFYKSLFQWWSDLYVDTMRTDVSAADCRIFVIICSYCFPPPQSLSNGTDDPLSNQTSPTNRFQRGPRLLYTQKILIVHIGIQRLAWVGAWDT